MKKALFLDRDGTLIRYKPYLSDPDQVELTPSAPAALRAAIDVGYSLFLFTNQSGIGRRYFTHEDALRVNARMEELLGLPGPVFVETCMAPEVPGDESVYRKPSPQFILEMIDKYQLDSTRCYMVGDASVDMMAGINAEITPIFVKTGHDLKDVPEVTEFSIQIFDCLAEFVRKVLQP